MTKMLGLLALLATTVPGAAIAQDQKTVIVTVSRADLALSDKNFRAKVGSAIEEVCGSYATVEFEQWAAIDGCRQFAWTEVRQQLTDLKSSETVKLGSR